MPDRSGRLNAAYIERKLRGVVGLVGGEQLQTLPDLAGLITLESDRPEWRAAANEFLWAIGRSVAAVVGQQGFTGVHNRPGSGILSVVTKISFGAPAVGNFTIGVNFPDSALPGDGVVFMRDQRPAQAGTIAGTRRLEGTSATPFLGSIVKRMHSQASQSVEVEGAWILPPNSELIVASLVANQTIDTSIEGYERPLEGLWELK